MSTVAIVLAVLTLLVGGQGILQWVSGRRQRCASLGLTRAQHDNLVSDTADEALKRLEKQRDNCHEKLAAVVKHMAHTAEEVNAGRPMPTVPMDLRMVIDGHW